MEKILDDLGRVVSRGFSFPPCLFPTDTQLQPVPQKSSTQKDHHKVFTGRARGGRRTAFRAAPNKASWMCIGIGRPAKDSVEEGKETTTHWARQFSPLRYYTLMAPSPGLHLLGAPELERHRHCGSQRRQRAAMSHQAQKPGAVVYDWVGETAKPKKGSGCSEEPTDWAGGESLKQASFSDPC